MDDHVSKLEHMGKETVKKLQDLTTAARQSGIEINVPDNCINKGALQHASWTRTSLALQQQPGPVYATSDWMSQVSIGLVSERIRVV